MGDKVYVLTKEYYDGSSLIGVLSPEKWEQKRTVFAETQLKKIELINQHLQKEIEEKDTKRKQLLQDAEKILSQEKWAKMVQNRPLEKEFHKSRKHLLKQADNLLWNIRRLNIDIESNNSMTTNALVNQFMGQNSLNVAEVYIDEEYTTTCGSVF